MPPLRLQPIFKQRPWGGQRLAGQWAKSDPVHRAWAESWEAVDLGADQSRVVGGPFDGQPLGELIRQRSGEMLGEHSHWRRLPFLFKLLDAAKTLSVQVHPNDEQATRMGLGAVGKSEAWLILAADPESRLFVGLKPNVDRRCLENHLASGTVSECLLEFPARVGDVFSVPAGTVHVIGAGVSLAEIQQPSDITFRLFDWNRRDASGNLRPLHCDQAMECIDFFRRTPNPHSPTPLATADFEVAAARLKNATRHEVLIHTEHFRWRRHTSSGAVFQIPTLARCRTLTSLAGTAYVIHADGSILLNPGETLFIPASCSSIRIEPSSPCTLLESIA